MVNNQNVYKNNGFYKTHLKTTALSIKTTFQNTADTIVKMFIN